METPDQEAPQHRQKKTVWLLAGGAVSLLVPLAGAIYLHWSENAGAAGPSAHVDVFERRDGEEHKITPTQTAVVTSPSALTKPSGMIVGAVDKPAGSSLDFIKSNADVQARLADSKAAGSGPAASTAPIAAAPAAAPAPAPVAAAKAKRGKKPFVMPKLQPSRGFTNFGTTGSKGAANTGAQTGQSAQDFLKNLPPGSQNDPQVQAYLKAHQSQ